MGKVVIILVDIIAITFLYCSIKLSGRISKEEDIEEINRIVKKLKY